MRSTVASLLAVQSMAARKVRIGLVSLLIVSALQPADALAEGGERFFSVYGSALGPMNYEADDMSAFLGVGFARTSGHWRCSGEIYGGNATVVDSSGRDLTHTDTIGIFSTYYLLRPARDNDIYFGAGVGLLLEAIPTYTLDPFETRDYSNLGITVEGIVGYKMEHCELLVRLFGVPGYEGSGNLNTAVSVSLGFAF